MPALEVQCTSDMKTRLVSMGNSRGVRLPKPLIEQVGLVDEVTLRVHNGAILISPARTSRAGWAEGAAQLATTQGEGLLDPPVATQFDRDDWKW
jgi:antitoxin MazE